MGIGCSVLLIINWSEHAHFVYPVLEHSIRARVSSGYKNPDFVILVVFMLYVEINIWLDKFGLLLHDSTVQTRYHGDRSTQVYTSFRSRPYTIPYELG